MIHFIKSQGKFQPIYKSDLEKWEKIKEGVEYTMRYRSNRNSRHHAKLFAIARTIIANESTESIWNNKSEYTLIKSTELELGYVNQIVHFDGEITLEPESISFENWSQERFEEFYDKAIKLWSEKFGYDIEDLENNYGEYI